MEEIIALILQFFFEIVFDSLIYGLFDFIPAGHQFRKTTVERIFCFIIGGGIAGISLIFWRGAFLNTSTMRMCNLILAPILCGLVSYGVSNIRKPKAESSVHFNDFWRAFFFTLGLVLIRFIFIKR